MPPRGRPVPKGRPPSSASGGSHIVVIGNCRLDVPDALGYELSHEGFSAELQDVGTLKVYEAVTRIITPPVGLSFTLLNPKNVDDPGKILLQDVLHLYNVELPAMSFAANTGKESPFLESCIMDGKYCTLILRKNVPGSAENELVGAVTFQILPPDTQQAEIPLAAVRHSHQRKGYGALMYRELKRRLMNVGVTSVFCWGDVESEAFWSKQGYVKVAEVDGRGKPKKFPIKGDMKKAMSIPGSATLMISYLDCGMFPTAVSVPPETEKGFIYSPSRPLNAANILDPNKTSSPTNTVTTPQLAGEVKSSLVTTPAETERKSPQLSTAVFQKCSTSITPLNMEGKLFSIVPDVAYRATSPGSATEPVEPGVNPFAILPFAVPNSEPLDFASGLPVTDITNSLPTKRSPRPHEKRTYVRRQQTTTSFPSGNLPQNFFSPTSCGKENIGEVNLVVNLEKAASDEEGRLSAFLGPRTKASHHKDCASVGSEDSARELESKEKADHEPKSSLSAFIGHRRKSDQKPECNLQIVPHGEAVQEHAMSEMDINVGQETGTGVEILDISHTTGLRPNRRGRPITSNVNDLQKGCLEDTVESDDFMLTSAPCGPKAGDKRGRPPNVHTSKPQEKVLEATGSDMVESHGSAASAQRKDKTEAIKRRRASTSAREDAGRRALEVSVPKVPSELVPKTAAQERHKAIENGKMDSPEKTVKKVSAIDHPSSSTSKAVGPKTGLKRGRPPKLVGTRTKRIKADTSSKGLDNNQRCSETDEAVQNLEQKKGDEEGLADILGVLVPAHKDAEADSAQESTDVRATSGSNPLDTILERQVHVTGRASADCGQVPLDDSLIVAAIDSEPASTTGAELGQQLEKPKYVIMFMNMADETKKRQLSKHVEKLGGLVTCEGSKCTHVVTMEVRRTLNFCVAISSGAWILSPDWLKASVKQKGFVGEKSYILTDKKFEGKYNASLKDVIPKAQQMPNLLLDGLYIYPTPNVHPPVTTISEIIKAAGGQVLATFEEALQLEKKPLGIVVACEGDMELAMAAAKAGLRTYNSDWLLTSIVKQELDFSVPQFTESL